MPLPITRRRRLFCLLVHCGILIHHNVGILSCYPSWHTPSDSNSSHLFWVVCHPSKTSPQKNLSRNPRIDFPFSPSPDHTLSYLWPMTHHSCIGWVQIGSAWALCVKSLSAAHAFAMVWRLIYVFCHSSLTFYGVNCFSDFPFFTGLLLSRAGPCLIVGFPFFELILCSFRNLVAISIILLCYSCRGVI